MLDTHVAGLTGSNFIILKLLCQVPTYPGTPLNPSKAGVLNIQTKYGTQMCPIQYDLNNNLKLYMQLK